MNKIITMSDSAYFDYGTDFLESLCNVNAQCILYGPDLTEAQITMLEFYNVRYEYIDPDIFYGQMQKLKFRFMLEQMSESGEYVTFCDFDTFFVKDWHSSLGEFDLGITVRRGSKEVKNKCLRAYSNGGVIFVRDTVQAQEFLAWALFTIDVGEHILLRDYDRIWLTLELGRTPEKTKYRTNHRWWVDQVFLSACCLQIWDRDGYDATEGKVGGYKVKLFDCDVYNRLDAKVGLIEDYYIGHKKVGKEP